MHQFATPIVIRKGTEIRLHPVRADEVGKLEKWLEDLIYRHPGVLPVNEIESAFGGLLPVARQVRTSSGNIDMLCVNAQGHLTLIEAKLWRNPQARREVIAQIVDYATELSHWSYSQLVEAVSRANKSGDANPLLTAARSAAGPGADDPDFERHFADSVARDLERGRFLLLIVGDGIRESVAEMAAFFQGASHLQFVFGLVELALFKSDALNDDELFVQPRVLARTQEVARAVIDIRSKPTDVHVTVSRPEIASSSTPLAERTRPTLTLSLFYEEMGREFGPELAEMVRRTLDAAPTIGLDVDTKGTAGPSLKYNDEDSGESFNFGQLTRWGTLGSSGRFSWKCAKLGLPTSIWQEYHAALVRIMSTARRIQGKDKSVSEFESIVGADGEELNLKVLLPHYDQWFEEIGKAIDAVRKAMSTRLV